MEAKVHIRHIILYFFAALLIISCANELEDAQSEGGDAPFLNRVVDEDTAVRTAINWMRLRFPDRSLIAVEQVDTETRHGEVLSYRVSLKDGGFVIVSADQSVKPVMAYSSTGSLKAKDERVGQVVDSYVELLNGAGLPDKMLELNRARWNDIFNFAQSAKHYLRNSALIVEPLIQTKWSQSGGYHPNLTYNKFTPLVNDAQTDRAPVGCAAVAFGQMLKHYDYPKTGFSSNRYCSSGNSVYNCWNGEIIEADFGVKYDWSNMPASLSSISSQQSVDAVATLLYHIGVALEVGYGEHGTNAQLENPTVFRGFKKHFRMGDVEQVSRSDYTEDEWISLIQNEIQNQRPVVLSGYDSRIGAGHAFILDGLDSEGNAHVNWGWGGAANGFYDISTLLIKHPSAGDLSFTEDLIAFINFSPATVQEGNRCNGREGLRCQKDLVCALGGDFENPVDELLSDEYGTCTSETVDDPGTEEELETVTERFDGTVDKDQWHHFGPFASPEDIEVSMNGTGDADLYVKKGHEPTASDYDCRPYKSSSKETCSLEGAGDFYVAVNGWAPTSEFDLTVVFKQ